jgi:hypothetical protein
VQKTSVVITAQPSPNAETRYLFCTGCVICTFCICAFAEFAADCADHGWAEKALLSVSPPIVDGITGDEFSQIDSLKLKHLKKLTKFPQMVTSQPNNLFRLFCPFSGRGFLVARRL